MSNAAPVPEVTTTPEAIIAAFESRGIEASINMTAGHETHVDFEHEGRRYAMRATEVGPRGAEPHLIAVTWLHDPLEAFGQRMDWKMVDGWDMKARPDAPVRSGSPEEVVSRVLESVNVHNVVRLAVPGR